MIQDSELFLNLWLSLKPYIPKKELAEAALAYVKQAEEFIDIEAAIQEVKGEDRALDAAFAELWPDDAEDEGFDDDDESYDSGSEDLDYD
jgi:hypothetical protein